MFEVTTCISFPSSPGWSQNKKSRRIKEVIPYFTAKVTTDIGEQGPIRSIWSEEWKFQHDSQAGFFFSNSEGALEPSLLMAASNPTRCSVSKEEGKKISDDVSIEGKGTKRGNTDPPLALPSPLPSLLCRCPADGCVVLYPPPSPGACVYHICINIPDTHIEEKKAFFVFYGEKKWKQKLFL